MEKVFLAFWGRKWQNEEIDKIIEKDSLVLLNLEKFTEDELNTYLIEQDIALPCSHIPKRIILWDDVHNSWWIIYNINYPDDYNQLLFLLELFLNDFLNPIYKFDRLWYEKLKYEPVKTFQDWYLDKINIDNLYNFLSNYKGIIDYSYWLRTRIYDWGLNSDNESFRLYVWLSLYAQLREYSNWKSIHFWEKEVMEIWILFETLFTQPKEKESIWYTLKKRIHFLSLDLIDNIENKIKEIYNSRSNFVHGSIFEKVRKEYKIIEIEWEYDIEEKISHDMFDKTKEYITILRKMLLLYYKTFKDIKDWVYSSYFESWKKIWCIDIIELSMFNNDVKVNLQKNVDLLKELIDY